jgi:hypothetical protein
MHTPQTHTRAPQTADFGPKTALKIVDGLREQLKAGALKSADDIRAAIKQQIVALLEPAGGRACARVCTCGRVRVCVGRGGGGCCAAADVCADHALLTWQRHPH